MTVDREDLVFVAVSLEKVFVITVASATPFFSAVDAKLLITAIEGAISAIMVKPM